MYTQPITRSHHAAIVIAIDRSGSMAESITSDFTSKSKAEWVCDVVNTILFELIEHARRLDGIHYYYDVAVIGYSGRGVEPLLGNGWFTPITQLAELEPKISIREVKRSTPSGELTSLRVQHKEWIEPAAEGTTPMYEALCEIYHNVKEWCEEPSHLESFPPIIFNITDGEASDCNPDSLIDVSESIRSLSTSDGGALLLNCHIASCNDSEGVIFPSTKRELGENKYAQMLYHASSVMPKIFAPFISQLKGCKEHSKFVGMSFNSSIHELLSMLNIGSISLPTHN